MPQKKEKKNMATIDVKSTPKKPPLINRHKSNRREFPELPTLSERLSAPSSSLQEWKQGVNTGCITVSFCLQ